MQSPGFITKNPISWENPPSLVRGDSRPLCQASEWEYNWDSEAGKRSPWQPSEEGQHVRLCTGLPHGSRWDPLVSSSLGTGDTRDFIESPAGRGGWSKSNFSMIEKIPPKGVSFSDLICIFAMSY